MLRAVTLVSPEESVGWLDALLDDLPRREARPRDRLRVVVEGAFCEQQQTGKNPLPREGERAG